MTSTHTGRCYAVEMTKGGVTQLAMRGDRPVLCRSADDAHQLGDVRSWFRDCDTYRVVRVRWTVEVMAQDGAEEG